MIALCPISAKDRLSYFNASGSRQWGLATGAWLGLPREPCYKTPQRRVAVGAIASLLTCASGCKITRYGGWRGLQPTPCPVAQSGDTLTRIDRARAPVFSAILECVWES